MKRCKNLERKAISVDAENVPIEAYYGVRNKVVYINYLTEGV